MVKDDSRLASLTDDTLLTEVRRYQNDEGRFKLRGFQPNLKIDRFAFAVILASILIFTVVSVGLSLFGAGWSLAYTITLSIAKIVPVVMGIVLLVDVVMPRVNAYKQYRELLSEARKRNLLVS